MRRILLSLAGLLAVTTLALADGKTDPGFKAAWAAAEKGQRVKLAIGKDTVSTTPLRCDSIDGFEDGIVEVFLEKSVPGFEPYVRWTAVAKPVPVVTPVFAPSYPTCPTCPNGNCPNVRYYRW